MVSCAVNGVPFQMLPDSGAQVTMVGRAWLEKALPHIQIQPLESLPTYLWRILQLMAQMFASMDGQMLNSRFVVSQGHVTIQVPLLISHNFLKCPVLGSNVIAEIIESHEEQRSETDISALLKDALSICSESPSSCFQGLSHQWSKSGV